MTPYLLTAEPIGEWGIVPTVECLSCGGHGKGSLDGIPQNWLVCGDCNGTGRVPGVLSWPCPTCDGSARSVVRGRVDFGEACSTCNGSGSVSRGELAAGLAAHEDREPQPSDGPDYHADHDAWERRGGPALVPASITEILTVQTYPVVELMEYNRHDWREIEPCMVVGANVELVGVSFCPGPGAPIELITVQFPVPPKPGDTVYRVLSRQALSEPITEYPCLTCSERSMVATDTDDPYGIDGWVQCPTCNEDGESNGCVPLPQGVGLYAADPPLQAGIEWRRP